MNVGDILPRRVDLLDRPALSVEGVDPLTYRELIALRDAYVSALLASQVRPGDRVGVMLRNCVEYWAIHLAIGSIGAITVRINFRLSRDEFLYVVKDSECSMLIVHDTVLDGLAGRPDVLSLRDIVVLAEGEATEPPLWAQSAKQWLDVKQQPADLSIDRTLSPHMIMYTSGTTGQPKGAIWTHQGTVMFGLMQLMQWGTSSDRVSMTVGPLYHVGSMEDVLLPTLMSGGHAVMMRSGQFSLRRALDLISSLRVTDALLFPAMIYELLERSDMGSIDFSSMKNLLTGGSPLLQSAVNQFNQRFSSVNLWSVYGLTEGGGISCALGPDEGRLYPEAAGRPLPMVSIRIELESGEEATHGQVGEICVRGPNTAVSYWRRDDESKATFAGAWVRTGDLGLLDEKGLLSVRGRAKDMIRSGDENVYAAEVERVLALHPSVVESAVIGIPDQRFGEAVSAVIVVRGGTTLTPANVVEHCRALLASYKKPRYVAFVDQLPRNATAKVLKQALRDAVSDGSLKLAAVDPEDDGKRASG
jgi:fatty-acyl-CoA synthase